MVNNSSINSQDHTYPTGYLADPHTEKIKVFLLFFVKFLMVFKITNIEIWGMGTDAAYNSHLMNKSK